MGTEGKYQYGNVEIDLSVDAALSGDRKKVMQAVMAHPLVRSLDDAEKTVEGLFEVYKDWLPQFN